MAIDNYVGNKLAIEKYFDDKEKSSKADEMKERQNLQNLFMQNLAESRKYQEDVVGRHYDSFGEAVNAIGGASMREAAARREAYDNTIRAMNTINEYIKRAKEEVAHNTIEEIWQKENEQGLRQLFEALPYMTDGQATNAFQVFVNSNAKATGDPMIVQSVDRDQGIFYCRDPKGTIVPINGYEYFRDIGTRHTMDNALKAAADARGVPGRTSSTLKDEMLLENEMTHRENLAYAREKLGAQDARTQAMFMKMTPEYQDTKNVHAYNKEVGKYMTAYKQAADFDAYLTRMTDLVREYAKTGYPQGRGMRQEIMRKLLRNSGLAPDLDSLMTQAENAALPVLRTAKQIGGSNVSNYELQSLKNAIAQISDNPQAALNDIEFLRKMNREDMAMFDSNIRRYQRHGAFLGGADQGGSEGERMLEDLVRNNGSTGMFSKGLRGIKERR